MPEAVAERPDQRRDENGNSVPTGLWQKLNAAIAEVDSLSKDGTNEHFKYAYTTAEEVYRVVRGPLLRHGLVVIPSVVGARSEGNSTVLNLHLRVIDSESGEEFEADWIGEGQDPGDKGPYKAATGGMKTWLRHLFLLPADDDPESDPETDRRAESKPAQNGDGTPQLKSFKGNASEGQRKFVFGVGDRKGLLDKAKFSEEEKRQVVEHFSEGGNLSKAGASFIIDCLQGGEDEFRALLLETVGASDVPGDPVENVPDETQAGDEDIPF